LWLKQAAPCSSHADSGLNTSAYPTVPASWPGSMAIELGAAIDVCALLCGVAMVAVTIYGMFGPVTGGRMSPSSWFSWHPVLMSLAFPCLMMFGRYSYLVSGEHMMQRRRLAHRIFMTSVLVAMLLGYLCVFLAHLPKRRFFGYDFRHGEWAEYKRVGHAFLGYAIILAVLLQAGMGTCKLQSLIAGKKSITYHGNFGKAIILAAAFNVLLAIRLWSWPSNMKVPLYALTMAAGTFGAIWPRPDEEEAERQSLLPTDRRKSPRPLTAGS